MSYFKGQLISFHLLGITLTKNMTNCEAVGIHLPGKGINLLYEAHEGFDQKFNVSESPFSKFLNQGMCINVIKGASDPNLPFYTKGGSLRGQAK
jgi:hypothetical protein